MDLPEMYSSVKQAMDQAWLGQGKQGKWRYSIPYRRLPETAGSISLAVFTKFTVRATPPIPPRPRLMTCYDKRLSPTSTRRLGTYISYVLSAMSVWKPRRWY